MVRAAGRSSTGAQLSAEQRAWLGLQENESVRVLAAGSRTILLEREGGSTAAALPWDRDLVLIADIRAFSLVDVLQLVHASAKSGFMFFEDRDHAKSVYLNRGEVVFATSNQAVDRLGQCLLRSGVITPEQFREARRAYSPPERFGKVLVERGFLTPRQLWNGVKLQVEEIVRSLFSYGAGTVLLWEGEVRPDNVVRLSLPTRRLISEGLKRREFTADQIRNIKNAYRTVFRQGKKLAEAIDELAALVEEQPEIAVFLDSLRSSQRGLVR